MREERRAYRDERLEIRGGKRLKRDDKRENKKKQDIRKKREEQDRQMKREKVQVMVILSKHRHLKRKNNNKELGLRSDK
jgi:hypothetical protein